VLIAAAAAAATATATIPIVFNTGSDPVGTGLVANFNRPGGNVTGVVSVSAEIGSKRLGLLHELVPTVTNIAVLNNQNIDTRPQIADMEAAARRLGKKLLILNAGTVNGLDQAFAQAAAEKAGAAVAVSSASSINDAFNSPCWRHATRFQRWDFPGNSPQPEVWSVTDPAFLKCFDRLASTSAASSKA
jgi:ABC-type uncharacterized transport system substrate-binding protein